MLERTPPQFRELHEITMQTDTRDILAHATRQAESYEDYFLVDIDAHVTETSFWPEILASIDNEVIRQMGQALAGRPGTANVALLSAFLREVVGEPVVLVGNSMGGMVSIFLAAAHPALVERLVLLDPSVPTRRRDADRARPVRAGSGDDPLDN